jgi:hypothetical protein
MVHCTSNYSNNILEADRGALKRIIRPSRDFQTMKTAAATLTGFEIMRISAAVIASDGGVEPQPKSVSLISTSVLQLERPAELGSICSFQVTAAVPELRQLLG